MRTLDANFQLKPQKFVCGREPRTLLTPPDGEGVEMSWSRAGHVSDSTGDGEIVEKHWPRSGAGYINSESVERVWSQFTLTKYF